MTGRPLVAVVGGGIAGLAGALELADAGARVVLLESGERLGGKILTGEFGGQAVETGPDAFLARVPHAVGLCRRLGLAHQLVSPATGSASVWVRGRLRKLPTGLVLGVPTRWGALARSGILSPLGLARAGLDLVLPPSPALDDRSVADLVGARLGSQVADRLVGPLVGGINAGVSNELSAKASAPVLDTAARTHRSLVLGLRPPRHPARRPAVGGSGSKATSTTNIPPVDPVFLTLPAGLSTLVGALADELEANHAELRTGTPVTALERTAGGRWALATPAGPVHADAVLLAVPAFVSAHLLETQAPGAAALLSTINYADVALVTLGYPESAIPAPLTGSGYLVPAGEGRMTTACTFTSRKWAQVSWRDHAIFRISVGRSGDGRHQALSDAELVAVVHGELADALGVVGEPEVWRVNRWPRAFPQYEVGHLDRVARIEADVARLPGLALAGAAYRGIGIPACIAGAQSAAKALLGDVGPAGE